MNERQAKAVTVTVTVAPFGPVVPAIVTPDSVRKEDK